MDGSREVADEAESPEGFKDGGDRLKTRLATLIRRLDPSEPNVS